MLKKIIFCKFYKKKIIVGKLYLNDNLYYKLRDMG